MDTNVDGIIGFGKDAKQEITSDGKVIEATQDSFLNQFYSKEGQKISVKPVFGIYLKPDNFQHLGSVPDGIMTLGGANKHLLPQG